ncbi:MAG: DUF1801 domain-containing protein [Candidatus Eisenbacteria bacterium]|uniref:DUF1801 domain-containing protein n=1 Tax=Eiseniibacteriota bacterium TaxID=2212470 RepID=A0A7Y2EDV2_UNCEI|nr:DUF1801 domain-containing protein [Candidatus Eisenbacteria bacterium]
MAELKTKKTRASVHAFLKSVEHETRQADAKVVLKMMEEITKEKPKMWGPSIIGFGDVHYKYESGREGNWFLTGFSPRKTSLTLYVLTGFPEKEELLAELGKHKTGKGCLYINKLEDVDMKVLKKLVRKSVAHQKKRSKK